MDKMKIKNTPIDDLRPYAHNPKTHPEAQIDKIARSIEEFGWTVPILIDADNSIIAGHGRLLAAHKLGLIEIPTICIDHLTEAQIRAYRIADNRLTESAWDFEMLESEIAILQDMDFDIDLTGFDDIDLGEMFPTEPEPENFDAEAAMDDESVPLVQAGELWILGDHRLLCGDSTKRGDVGRLMDGEGADMVFTDPPYSSGGFQETGKRSGSIGARNNKKILSDTLSTRGYKKLIAEVLENVQCSITIFIFCDWKMWIENFDIIERAGYVVRNMLVWDKKTMGMGMPFRNQHELIIFGSKQGGKIGNGNTPNVLSIGRELKNGHPNQKPVELIQTIITQIDVDSCVYDPFGGSGSTLIACEQLKRRCYMMELDPHYCGVILDRWANYTKEDPIREDGMMWSELKESQQL